MNSDLLKLIPSQASRVLEVGCGTGGLGAAYKEGNPAVQYVGIELNHEAANLAASRIDRVAVGDAELIDLAPLGIEKKSLDCLVYGDVLEHLVDPWGLLARHVQWLRPGGSVVSCIPNTQHWSVLVGLLAGRWEYADSGLLDGTHLRFFTLHSIEAMFERAGLTIVEIQARQIPSEKQGVVVPVLEAAAQQLGIKTPDFEHGLKTFQYLVKARS